MSKASAYFTIGGQGGRADVGELKSELDTLHGIFSVSMSDKANTIAVDYDTSGTESKKIRKIIENLGYDVTGVKTENHIM